MVDYVRQSSFLKTILLCCSPSQTTTEGASADTESVHCDFLFMPQLQGGSGDVMATSCSLGVV